MCLFILLLCEREILTVRIFDTYLIRIEKTNINLNISYIFIRRYDPYTEL